MNADLLGRVRARAIDPSTRVSSRNGPGGLPPPASDECIQRACADLGVELPEDLCALYSRVANGGFGPAYGIIGLPGGALNADGLDVVGLYSQYSAAVPDFPQWAWPAGILPICEWGCAIYVCLDCRTSSGPVVTFDPSFWSSEEGEPLTNAMAVSHESLSEWLEDWAAGRDLSQAMYEPHPEGPAIGKNPFSGEPMELHRVAGLRGRRP